MDTSRGDFPFFMSVLVATTQVSYRFLALGCFPANLVSDVVCVVFVLRVGSLKG